MWIAFGVGLTLVVVLIVLVVVIGVRRRQPDRSPKEMSGDEMFNLGVVFTGAGVALFVSVGPSMIGLLALGLIFMATGARKKREQ